MPIGENFSSNLGGSSTGTKTSNSTSSKSGNNGSSYTFRSYVSNPNVRGNWNTGGSIVGTGSMNGGIQPFRGNILRQAARPQHGRRAIPTAFPEVPLPTYPPAGGPPTRVDLNPATLAPLTIPNYQSTFPARPGVSPSVGVVGKDQSRLPGMNGSGRVGGGQGGGGGGGW